MCTLIVMHRHVPGAPLVVAANRDEFYDRRAAAPALWSGPNGITILSPRDLHAGGTWLGLSSQRLSSEPSRGASGLLFAALTNRPNPQPDPTRRSRGLLVVDALGYTSAAKAAAAFESLRSDQYNPFNLLIADAKDAFTVVCNDNRGGVRVERLEAGVHVIGNAEPNDQTHAKTNRILSAAIELSSVPSEEVLDRLAELCRSHDTTVTATHNPAKNAALAATCVHHEGYGTRSSILFRLSEDPNQSELHHTDGAPCAHPYEDSTSLLHELSRMASYNGVGPCTRTVI